MGKQGIALGKIPHGVLNNFTRDQLYESFDVSTDNFMDVFIKVMRQSLGPKFSLINRTFNGVCVQVLSNKESQTLLASGHNFLSFQRGAKTTSKTTLKAIRVFIPEIHSDRALPNSILSPTEKDKELMQAMFPVFISQTETESKKKIAPGDIVEVQIKNNLGSGVYLHKLSDGNATINIWNEKGGKSGADSFKCAIIKYSKVITDDQNRISSGTVISSAPESGSNIGPNTLKEQYIKYLYEKERAYIMNLKATWTKGAFKGMLAAATTNLDKSFIWGLMYQTCGYLFSGLSVGGRITKSVQSIKDNYGIFRYSKEYFDEALTKFTDNQWNTLGEGDHSTLLDPHFSLQFFLFDFVNFLEEKSATENFNEGIIVAEVLMQSNKQLITDYFKIGTSKTDFLLPSDFGTLMDDYDLTGSDDWSPENFSSFSTFNDWLTAKSSGIPAEPLESSPAEDIPSENPQGPTETKPPAPPSCSPKELPPSNDYIIHVDAQKKMVRKFLDGSESGLDLDFAKSEHIGIKSIKFADLDIPTSFKVLRFDDTSPLYADSKRWFNANNAKNLISNNRYLRSYYRNRKQITYFTVGSLGNNIDKSQYYKSALYVLDSYNKPLPHFIVSPNGQIIQLVDAAAAINNSSITKRSGIIASFGEGPGNLYPIVNTTPTQARPNYVLIRDINSNSAYRYCKLGSKAALQSMQKLITFCITHTNIKYNLAAIDGKIKANDINKFNIQASGHYRGVGGMNFIYYAWTLGLAYFNNGRNILLEEEI